MYLDTTDNLDLFRIIKIGLDNFLILRQKVMNRSPFHFSKRSMDLQIVQARLAALIRLPTTLFGSFPSLTEKACRIEVEKLDLQPADS
jgi:hypothetical protein